MSDVPGALCKRQAFLLMVKNPVWNSDFYLVEMEIRTQEMFVLWGWLRGCKNEYRAFALGLFEPSFPLEQDESLSTPELKQGCLEKQTKT